MLLADIFDQKLKENIKEPENYSGNQSKIHKHIRKAIKCLEDYAKETASVLQKSVKDLEGNRDDPHSSLVFKNQVCYPILESIHKLIYTQEKILTRLEDPQLLEKMKKVGEIKTSIERSDILYNEFNRQDDISKLQNLSQEIKELEAEFEYDKSENYQNFKSVRSNLRQKMNDLKFDTEQILKARIFVEIEKVIFPKAVDGEDEVYIGDVNDKGQKSGRGILTNGKYLYKGQWKNDKKEGFGILVYEDGIVFEGLFRDDKSHIGRWTKNGNIVFFGRKTKAEIDLNEGVGIGLENNNYIRNNGEAHRVINMVYLRGRPLPLVNVSYNLNYNEESLEKYKGDNCDESTMIEWLNGIRYKGFFMNYRPVMLGTYILPSREEVFGITLPYVFPENRDMDHEKFVPLKNVYPKNISSLGGKMKLRLDMLNGYYYDGTVDNLNLFHGFGYLGDKNRPGWFGYGVFKHGKEVSLLASNSNLFDLDEQKRSISIMKDLPYQFFNDSVTYKKKTNIDYKFWTFLVINPKECTEAIKLGMIDPKLDQHGRFVLK